jgi:leader peptidase (prepilin peptidase)/N-methyltransferase
VISLDIPSAAAPFAVFGVGLLGAALSLVSELLIAKLLPGFGEVPGVRVRTVTSLVTAAICIFFALRLENEGQLPAFLFLVVLGVQLARIDIDLHLLPNALVLLLLLGGVILLFAPTLAGQPWDDFLRALAGGAILFGTYLVLALISPQGIGMGDVKLAGPAGLYLGYLGWSQLLYGGLLGFIVGGIASAFYVMRHRKNQPAEVAYGPSILAAAMTVALVAG